MSTELSTITTGSTLPQTLEEYRNLNQEARDNLTGQGGGQVGNILPQLRINYDSDVEVEGGETVDVKKGTWKLNILDASDNRVTVYSKKATIRMFLRGYRWAAYNQADEQFDIMSSIFRNWGDPVVDNLGHEFAGGNFKKGVVAIHPEFDPDGSTPLKCQQIIYALTTLEDAKDMYGKVHTVVDVPSMYIAKGSAFVPISDLFRDFSKKGQDSGDWSVSLTTQRKKNGSVTYFVPVPVVESEHLYTVEEFAILKKFEETLNSENREVLAKYRKVIENKVTESRAETLVDGSDLSNDFKDELPESMQAA